MNLFCFCSKLGTVKKWRSSIRTEFVRPSNVPELPMLTRTLNSIVRPEGESDCLMLYKTKTELVTTASEVPRWVEIVPTSLAQLAKPSRTLGKSQKAFRKWLNQRKSYSIPMNPFQVTPAGVTPWDGPDGFPTISFWASLCGNCLRTYPVADPVMELSVHKLCDPYLSRDRLRTVRIKMYQI